MGRAFKEQIIWLTRAWDGWSEAEQVVALYSVARKLSPIPTRFLQILLAFNFPQDSNNDIMTIEAQANDPVWVSHICEAEDGGTTDLLQSLPLLRPSNGEAKAQYLSLIPKVLSQALSQGNSQPAVLEKARQLLSYALIHPAITPEERRSLVLWLRALEERLSQLGLDCGDVQVNCEEKDEKRATVDASSCHETEFGRSFRNGSPHSANNPNSSNLLGREDGRWGHLEIPASPNNSATSSRSSESESFTEDVTQGSSHPGMRDIAIWLKSLRLHKYYGLLCNYRYDEFMALDEDSLGAKGVTKGARHKIILSIAKLKERSRTMETIEKDLLNGGSILTAVNQLKQISITPMMPSKDGDIKTQDHENLNSSARELSLRNSLSYSEEPDLPSQFTRVMGKVCTQLLVSTRPPDESMSIFLQVVDRCSHHESFTEAQIKKLLSWKQQIIRIWHPLPPRGKDLRQSRRWSHQFQNESFNRCGRLSQPRHSSPNSPQMASLLAAAALGGIGGMGNSTASVPHLIPPHPYYGISTSFTPYFGPRNGFTGVPIGGSSLAPPQHLLSKRPSLQETPSQQLRSHVTLHRTRSAPSRPHQPLQLGHSRGGGVSPNLGVIGPPAAEPYSTWASTTDSPSTSSGKKLLTVAPSDQPTGNEHLLPDAAAADHDLTNRLESLCLSMTEHALE